MFGFTFEKVIRVVSLGLIVFTSVYIPQTHANNTLWVAESEGVLKVATVDGVIQFEIPVAEGVDTLTIDEDSGRVWTFGSKTLRAFEADGTAVVDVLISSIKETDNASGLEVNAERVWLSVKKQLLVFDDQGQLLDDLQFNQAICSMTLDTQRAQLWAATRNRITVLNQDSQIVFTLETPVGEDDDEDDEGGCRGGEDDDDDNDGNDEDDEGDDDNNFGFKVLAYDVSQDQVWVSLSPKDLRRYHPDGQLAFDVTLQSNAACQFISPDGQGGLWAADKKRLAHIDNTGLIEFQFKPFANENKQTIIDIAADPTDQTVWVANKTTLKQYDNVGALQNAFTPDLGDGVIRNINRLRIAASLVEIARLFPSHRAHPAIHRAHQSRAAADLLP